jgi:predicted lipoprotein with Yx(FWY)xxD motif
MQMRRIGISLTVMAALWLLGATAATGATPRGAKVQARHTAVGTVLANGRGFTLYVFTRDSRKHDNCLAMSGCTGVWPVLKTGANPAAGPGVKRALLGTIRLRNGTRQVTYAGHPLYTYIGDGGPGETAYVGTQQFGGRWYAISPAGRVVK